MNLEVYKSYSIDAVEEDRNIHINGGCSLTIPSYANMVLLQHVLANNLNMVSVHYKRSRLDNQEKEGTISGHGCEHFPSHLTELIEKELEKLKVEQNAEVLVE